jgi:hypothetical protein
MVNYSRNIYHHVVLVEVRLAGGQCLSKILHCHFEFAISFTELF